MYRALFTVPVMIATASLVLHSGLFRGATKTKIFWGYGYLLAFGRELVYQNFLANTYRFTGTDLKLLNVPLTVPMGWLFEAYISLYVAQYILGTDAKMLIGGRRQITARQYRKEVLPVIALACIITSTITIAIENVAVRMHWWQMMDGTYNVNPGWIQGHMFTVFWLLTAILYLTYEPLRLRRNLVYIVLAWAFNLVVELGFLGNEAWRSIPLTLIAWSLVGAFLVVLALWPELLLYFLISMPIATFSIMKATEIWSMLGMSGHGTFPAFMNVTTLLFIYALYLVWAYPRTARGLPTDLL